MKNNTNINNNDKNLTKYRNGKSYIRNMEGVFSPLIFEEINYKLEGKQNLTDVDGQFEFNRNLFIIESKQSINSINSGQLISLFLSCLNTYECGKLAQLVFRIDFTDDEGKPVYKDDKKVYLFVIFGSTQFKQYLNNTEVVPDYKTGTNKWLANRLERFQMLAKENWDNEVVNKNKNLFNLTSKMKNSLFSLQERNKHKYIN